MCRCVVVLHAGGRLAPGSIASPPGSGGSTGNTGNSNSAAAVAAVAAAAAARRGNRRLTRNESRYHSGEYISSTRYTRTIQAVTIGIVNLSVSFPPYCSKIVQIVRTATINTFLFVAL